MGKVDRVRYDAPALGPVTVSVSHGTDLGLYVQGRPFTDVGAVLDKDLGDGNKLGATLGYVVLDTGLPAGNEENSMGAITFMSGTGISISVAASKLERDDGSLDGRWRYIKLGFDRENQHMALDYSLGTDQLGEDAAVKGTQGKEVGVGYVYDFAKGIKGYAGYKIFTIDDHPTLRLDALKVVTFGMYLRF
jgi:hypothetical protein